MFSKINLTNEYSHLEEEIKTLSEEDLLGEGYYCETYDLGDKVLKVTTSRDNDIYEKLNRIVKFNLPEIFFIGTAIIGDSTYNLYISKRYYRVRNYNSYEIMTQYKEQIKIVLQFAREILINTFKDIGEENIMWDKENQKIILNDIFYSE